MIPFEIFKSVEICTYVHTRRFLFKFAKYIDDISAHSHSDSDIFANVEKADFVEFLDDNSSMLAGSEGDLDT